MKALPHLLRPFHLLKEVVQYRWKELELKELISELRTKPRWLITQEWEESPDHSSKEIGDIGEDLAAQYLKTQGYKLLYQNYTPQRGGEIDLICRKDKTLLFIEVKTRIAPTERRPLLNVDKAKREQLKKGAFQYLQLLQKEEDNKFPLTHKQLEIPTRFDVVEVILHAGKKPQINHIQGLKMERFRDYRDPFQKDFL